jgi:phosphoinositide-3-kinase regulatory subunit 4
MDIFSTGVVIAELFLEDILFDHQKLLLYKYGKFNLDNILSKIKDEKLKELLKNMLNVDPSKRNNINFCLNYFAEEICPISFSRMYLHLNNLLIQSNYWKPDKRIALIKHYWKQTWKTLFGKKSEAPQLYQTLNLGIFNKLLLDDPYSKPSSSGNHFKLIFNLEDDKELNFLRETDEDKLEEKKNAESSLVLINLILQGILNTKYPSSKLCAIEMLRHLSDNLPYEKDLIKIQTIIPYLSKLFKDNSNLVKFSALNEVINMLNSIDMEKLILPSSDYNVFDAYIFPYILELYNSNEPSLILGFSNLIDKITDIEHKFLQISMKSRFFNIKNLSNSQISLSNSSSLENNLYRSEEYGFYSTSNVSRGEEIIQTYDTDLYEFKITLFKIMEDILSKNEEIDIQRLLIRKLASLINFTGRRETNIFTQFIISNFNRRDWIIHREIFNSLPSLVINLGQRHLMEYIIPCMDMMISNNLDEIKILEMIKSLHILLKMGYLETISGVDLFKKILHFIIHPNYLIRNEVINFAETLIYSQNNAEIFTYLRPEFKKYLTVPFLIIKNENDNGDLRNSIKEKLSRVIYEMNISDVKYSFQLNFEDAEAHQLLRNFITTGMKGQIHKNYEYEKNILDKQMQKMKNMNILEGKNVGNLIRKEFIKAIKNLKEEDFKSFEYIYIGKLISLSSLIDTYYQSPSQKRRKSSIGVFYNYNNSSNGNNNSNIKISDAEAMIYQDNFKVKFLVKSLNLAIDDESCLDESNINYIEFFI